MTPITLDFSNMVMERLGADGVDPDRRLVAPVRLDF